MYETVKVEKALLVVVRVERDKERWSRQDIAEEFTNLVHSTGIEVAGLIHVNRTVPTPALYIGKGKAFELAEQAQGENIDVVIFNSDLNFTQQRNLEEIIGVKTIDRTQLILDIFARHAHTQEGSLQVELAQMEYLLPRLRGKGIMLSRLGGGIGTRGPGEKKLEVERRGIADKIIRLKKELEQVRKHRKVQREKRFKERIGVCSLVGYTNAGKSTLLNSLTDSEQKTSDSLFTTLDPISRVFSLAPHHKIILTDTVGFIYKLPHHLIEAFQATLEELQYADLLIHVVDASSNNCKQLIMAVGMVLKELGLEEKPRVLAFNKIDRLSSGELDKLRPLYPQGIFISALNKINLDVLLEEIKQQFSKETAQFMVSFPFSAMELLDYLYQHAEVTEVEYGTEEVRVRVRIKERFIPYLLKKKAVLKQF